MGDVAITARILSSFKKEVWNQYELFWVIDHSLIPLAKALCKDTPPISWIPVDSSVVFSSDIIRRFRAVRGLYDAIRRLAPDGVALMHRDPRYLWLARFATDPSTKIVTSNDFCGSEYERQWSVMNALGLGVSNQFVGPLEHCNSNQEFLDRSRRIVIGIGGGTNLKVSFPEKKWPHFLELVKMILKKTTWHLSFVGSQADAEETEKILQEVSEEGIPLSDRIENHCGRISLESLPDFIKRHDAALSVDTGLAHIAANVFEKPHQRIFTLFGPTDWRVWAAVPRIPSSLLVLTSGQSCSPCYLDDGKYKPCIFSGTDFQRCMKMISAEYVFSVMSAELR